MSLEAIMDSLPDYAKDLRLNWNALTGSEELTGSQKWGTLIASAFVAGHKGLLDAVLAEAGDKVPAEVVNAAKSAAAIMGMNNVYYRFQHLASNKDYTRMPARLRMNIMRTHGADQLDFELWSLAASAINGCGQCIDSHEATLIDKGVSPEVVLQAVRLAAVTKAVAAALLAEGL
jgi:alkyl hydroperoxide reductase subunit D